MATYFDLLPDDLLSILLKENKTLKDVNSNFKRVFDDMVKLISGGLVQPMEYFTPVIRKGIQIYDWGTYTIENKRVSGEEHKLTNLIDKIVNCANTITYFHDGHFDYSGNISFICQTDIEFYYDILGLVGISPDKIPSLICYLYLDGSWNSESGTFSIYVDVTWKNFWNMKLDHIIRQMLMIHNGLA